MSAALHSLMRDAPEPEENRGSLGALLRFITIGASGALSFVALSGLMISLHTGFEDWIVNTACYAALIIPVYLLHRRFSFQSEASHRQALPRYMAVQGMALVLAALFSFVVHGVLTLPTLAASLLVIALTSGINFLVLRSWAFARGRQFQAVPA
jgi:putative flippase GtrA